MRHANFAILKQDDSSITLLDQGPWTIHPTITNDAEWVVEQMVRSGLGARRLYYVDSEGETAELRVEASRFAGFEIGPGRRG
ncbi:MAG: hypothetical protein V4510_09910 [bacterium]